MVNFDALSSRLKQKWSAIFIGFLLLFLAHATALIYRIEPSASLWFPPSGVGIALTIWFGPVGIFLTGIASVLMAPFWGNDGWNCLVGLTDAIEPLLAWWLYRHWFGGSLAFKRVKDAIAFLASAPLAACGTSAIVGTSIQISLGKIPATALAENIGHWWLGNAIGTMAIAPTAVLLLPLLKKYWQWLPEKGRTVDSSSSWQPLELVGWMELAVLVLASFATAWFAVRQSSSPSLLFLQLSFFSFIPILWGAVRFETVGGMTLSTLAIVISLLDYLLLHPGTFFQSSFLLDPIALQVHQLNLLVQSAVALLVGTAMSERANNRVTLAVERANDRLNTQLSEKLLQLNHLLGEANARLFRSEERFRTSVENMLDCFGIYRTIRDENEQILDFRIEYVNQAACIVNRMTREEQIGKRLCELFPGHLENGLFEEYCRVVETGNPLVKDELIYEDIFGQRRLVRAFDIRIVKLEDGFVATWRDVTERKLAEEELLRLSQEFKALGENSPDAISRLDRELRHIYVNPAMEKATGMKAEALIGKTPKELGGDTALARECEENLQAVLSSGKSRIHEFAFPLPNGTAVSYQARLVPEFALDGSIASILVASRDISELKQAQIALQKSEERYRMLAEAMPQIVWTADATGAIDYFNQRWYDYSGTSAAESMGLKGVAAVHPEERELVLEHWMGAVVAGESFELEYRIRRYDGTYNWFINRGIPIRDRRGKIISWVGTITDIDDRKQNEEARERLLHQEQVAREAAETANRVKDEFLAVLSHELRSPLNPILGWSQLLQSPKSDPALISKGLETIERNVKLQIKLIEDLLDVSRILQGKLHLNVAPVDLALTVEAAIETVRLAARSKSIDIETFIDFNLGRVEGDDARLQQIVWNLLANAIKFTPAAGKVTVRVERVEKMALIQVIDTGKGISADFLPYVFDRFRQADSTISRKFGGLGLGLAIVRHLVELHGGSIRAESAGEERGATFTVSLPVEGDFSSPLLTGGEMEQSLDLNGSRILLVDDDANTREFLTFTLEGYGAEVVSVSHAFEALSVLKKEKFTILLSDIGMPEVDGYAFIRQVRSTLGQPASAIPAVALTAYATQSDRQLALEAGFQTHIAKPVDIKELVLSIAKLVAI